MPLLFAAISCIITTLHTSSTVASGVKKANSTLFCACVEPIVPDLTEKLNELRRIKAKQDAVHAQELQEADDKFENMKEALLTENALLRQSSVISLYTVVQNTSSFFVLLLPYFYLEKR